MNTSNTLEPPSPPRRVVISGATGWAGGALARGLLHCDDLQLVAAVSRKHAGKTFAQAMGLDAARPGAAAARAASLASPVRASAAEALAERCEVYVEYSKSPEARANIEAALWAGAHVVVGSSGLTDDDYAALDERARAAGRGVLACGNFAITVVLLQKFAEMAAQYIDCFELIDYAKETKSDAPSGTVRELANRLGRIRQPRIAVPIDEVKGPDGVRGATMSGIQVHAIRAPGFNIGVEAIFGLPDQRLHLRHEALGSAEPYVPGALLAIRRVHTLVGVHRGLDRVMDL